MSRLSALERILRFNAGREPERLQLKFQAMRAGVFSFMRGTAHLFYDECVSAAFVADAPATWLCGDLHLENFGSYRGDNELVYFDINDFDEALLAPCTLDLLRFVCSVLIAARTLEVNETDSLALCATFLERYRTTLHSGSARWVERATAQGMVRELLVSLKRNPRAAFIRNCTAVEGKKRRLCLDTKKALPVSAAEQRRLSAFMKHYAAASGKPEFFQLLSCARSATGTASLGIERYMLLVEGHGARGDKDGHFVLDLKQALPPSPQARLALAQPRWKSHALRIVEIQQRVQAIPPALLSAVSFDGQPFVLSERQPQEDRVNLALWNGKLRRLQKVMATMGEVTAWAHLRGCARQGSALVDTMIEFAADGKWEKPLIRCAQDCAQRIESDWRDYCVAFDDGAVQPR